MYAPLTVGRLFTFLVQAHLASVHPVLKYSGTALQQLSLRSSTISFFPSDWPCFPLLLHVLLPCEVAKLLDAVVSWLAPYVFFDLV